MKNSNSLPVNLDANQLAGELGCDPELIVKVHSWGIAPTPKITLKGRWVWPESDITAWQKAIAGLEVVPKGDPLEPYNANIKSAIRAMETAYTTSDVNERFRCLIAARRFRDEAQRCLEAWRQQK